MVLANELKVAVQFHLAMIILSGYLSVLPLRCPSLDTDEPFLYPLNELV
jgi:hypothetical protein